MKKRGFTLAELLITLAIIGVIAAVALPQFISGMQNQSNASRLSVAITDYENIFGMMMEKENKTDIFATKFGKAWAKDNQSAMKDAMAEYIKIARSSKDNNTSGLGYISYLFKQIIPSAWARESTNSNNNGNAQSNGCPSSRPSLVPIPNGTDLGHYLQCYSNHGTAFCCEYKGNIGGQEYVCCSETCPADKPEIVQGTGVNPPRTGCVSASNYGSAPEGLLPKNYFCCPPAASGCPVERITSEQDYDDYCKSNTCPENIPELCFAQCVRYKCASYGLAYTEACSYNDPSGCANKITTLCKCSNGGTVSATNGDGCTQATLNTSAVNRLNGNCSGNNANVRPTPYYCCSTPVTCDASVPYPSPYSYEGCQGNLNGSGYCCSNKCAPNYTPTDIGTDRMPDDCYAPGGEYWCCAGSLCDSGYTLMPGKPSSYPSYECKSPNNHYELTAHTCCRVPENQCPEGERYSLTDISDSEWECKSSNGLLGDLTNLVNTFTGHGDKNTGFCCKKKSENPCPNGGSHKDNKPASGWNCYDSPSGSGYCCTQITDPCVSNPNSQECCEHQNKRWSNGQCCESAYYYGSPKTCHASKCASGTWYQNKPSSGYNCSHAPAGNSYGWCCTQIKNPCTTNPNSQECCAYSNNHWYNDSCCEKTSGNHWANNTCCDNAHYFGFPTQTCHNCTENYYRNGGCQYCPNDKQNKWPDGTCHYCPSETPNQDGTKCCDNDHYYNKACNKCIKSQHEVPIYLNMPVFGTKCISCRSDQTFVNNKCKCPAGKIEIEGKCVDIPEATKTPFHYVQKVGEDARWNANTDDISFSYAESDAQTGANMFYGKIEEYKDASGKERKAATIYIDVNGKSWPNAFGRDVFALVLDQDGHLYPYGSEKVAQIASSKANENSNRGEEESGTAATEKDYTWKGSTERYGCTNKGTYNGLGCTARLVENHFKVDY